MIVFRLKCEVSLCEWVAITWVSVTGVVWVDGLLHSYELLPESREMCEVGLSVGVDLWPTSHPSGCRQMHEAGLCVGRSVSG